MQMPPQTQQVAPWQQSDVQEWLQRQQSARQHWFLAQASTPTLPPPSTTPAPAQLIRHDPTPPAAPASNANMQLANPSIAITTTQTTTERYKGEHAGGTARAEAARTGSQALTRFEQTVQTLLRHVGNCPSGHPWYVTDNGYLCAEGWHFVYHTDIDKAFQQPGWRPPVVHCNLPAGADPEADATGFLVAIHPPPIDYWQPMHRAHAAMMMTMKMQGYGWGGETEKAKVSSKCECFDRLGMPTNHDSMRRLRQAGFRPELSSHGKIRG